MNKVIYYLPGHAGRLDTGLGLELTRRGFDVTGRATVDDFRRLPFGDQVDAIAGDLEAHFWAPDARVIANSFGAYFFLHAQAKLASFPGKVLLLSPILGAFGGEDAKMNFVPARDGVLQFMATNGVLNLPQDCEIHVGSEDWQSNPKSVLEFSRLTGVKSTVLPEMGHALDRNYVQSLLDIWLC
jgi:hypothetical protein